MAVDAFLQFTTTGATGVVLNGETKDQEMSKKNPIPFQINTWKFAVGNATNIGSASGGGGAGKAKFESFEVTKNIDTSSPMCFLTCCVGGHFDEVNLFVRKAGASSSQSGQTYLQFGFKMVAVSNINWKNGEVPEETITFEYGAIQISYTPQDSKGALSGKPIVNQWSQISNTADFIVDT
jgi:type VI secretion system secreted protein Hcp